jgi:small redox-active disulfide protein 2
MKIEILGTGCAKCKTLIQLAQDTVNELGISAEIVKVYDINEIMKYDVMMTPALVIDKEIKSSGRIPSKDEIKKWINAKK